jgi:hypothetical protein
VALTPQTLRATDAELLQTVNNLDRYTRIFRQCFIKYQDLFPAVDGENEQWNLGREQDARVKGRL